MKFNKTICSFLFFTFFTFSSVFSQNEVGVRISQAKMYGINNYLLSPSVYPELVYSNDDDDNKIFKSYSIGFFQVTDFDTLFYIKKDMITRLYERSWFTYEYYRCTTLGINFQYNYSTKDFSPFLGYDCYFLVSKYSFSIEEPNLMYSESTNNGYLSIVPSMGVRYDIGDKIRLKASVGNSLNVGLNFDTFSFWKTSFSITYLYE